MLRDGVLRRLNIPEDMVDRQMPLSKSLLGCDRLIWQPYRGKITLAPSRLPQHSFLKFSLSS